MDFESDFTYGQREIRRSEPDMNKENLKKELNKLFKAMDNIADNYLSKRNVSLKKAEVFRAIYQQLGLLWEFLGCLCKHWDGYKKKGDQLLCKICGKVKGTKGSYYIFPVTGKKSLVE